MKSADLKAYSVYQLLVSGSRFTDGFDIEDAVALYLDLHPEAKRHEIEAELQKEVERRARKQDQ